MYVLYWLYRLQICYELKDAYLLIYLSFKASYLPF